MNIAYLRTLGLEGLAAHDDAGGRCGGALAGRGRRALRRGGDRDLDVRLSRTSRCWRRRASTTRWRPTARSCPRSRGCIRATRRPAPRSSLQSAWAIAARAHRRVRRPARHRRLRGLDLLWPDRGRTVRPPARLGRPTGFRTPGYPWLPAFFVLVAVVVVFSTIRDGAAALARRRGPAARRDPRVLLVQVFAAVAPRPNADAAKRRSRRTCSGPRPASPRRSIWPAATCCTARSTICRARARRSTSARPTTTATRRSSSAIAAPLRRDATIASSPATAARARTSSRSPRSSAPATRCWSSGRPTTR